MARSRHLDPNSSLPRRLAATALGLAAAAVTAPAAAQYDCSSPDPAMWPPASKPYFMLALDSSGSMSAGVLQNGNPLVDSCGFGSNRLSHARCAVRNTALAFDGQVNLGLATFAVIQDSCSGNSCNCTNGAAQCFSNCQYFCYTQEINTRGDCAGCGPRPGSAATAAGAFIRVPMLQDAFWSLPPNPPNLNPILAWADNACGNEQELFAAGNTPLNGMLRDMRRYFASGWSSPDGVISYPSPLSANDLAGTGVNGGTGCRSLNVILMTDGDETCDTQQDAVNAAAALYQTGVTVGGKTFKISTHVINFAGGNQANTDAIAAAGGTGASYFATNEVQLSQALANIISRASQPEVCDNVDNNCNGCVDEGYLHYCNVKSAGQCCSWATTAQRQACLTNYQNSIAANPPNGDLTLLPCTTAAQAQNSSTWLCFNPGEVCDNADNNCQAGVDEGMLKCGNPAQCPTAEVCDNADNDCDGLVNEGNVCAACAPTAEVCDGCDNDCDGIADDGAPGAPCGVASPPNCAGTAACNPPQPVPQPGGCVAGGGYGQCSNSPQAEVCDNVDNDCDGIADDGVAPTACVPPGTPPGLVYGGTSQCQQGSQPCNGACSGFVGPSPEICDGIDNDCDGVVDDGVIGVGQSCGINQAPCQPGTTACVNGALVCQGGVGPQPEQCDGIDNNCNGAVDEAPLADAPPAGQNGCWNLPGNCCSWPSGSPDITWCPPAGATCNGNGALSPPCNRGTLACTGGAWQCQGGTAPFPEVCDGVDNDCNAQIDDGNIPQEGQACGSDTGECEPGVLDCTGGVLDCVGDVPPSPELCDGLDNNCNGQVDDGIQSGGPCTPAYDTTLYPGPRTAPPCAPGVLLCDPVNGLSCQGGVGPNPEVCDGIDNDCDGAVDEMGAAPDGTDGTGQLGQPCGTDTGECAPGTIACVNGAPQCVGGQNEQPEQCDCLDNNCDGTVDNPPPNGAICSAGKDCVQGPDGCGCAEPCGGEIPCPPGQKCEMASTSPTGTPGFYCVPDYDAICGDCSTKTATNAAGEVVCAPLGTTLPSCVEPPVCVCKNQNGCREPCFGVTCPAGQQCANHGPLAGQCVADASCWSFPCAGCDQACHDGACVDNPCDPNPCQDPGAPVCKPSDDFTGFTCVPSCAGVQCPSGQACVDGACQPACDPACSGGQGCDTTQTPPTCVQCAEPCLSGCCNPQTGQCGDCPCEGVVCPGDQICRDGSCFDDSAGTGGSGQGGSGQGGGATGTGTGTGGSGQGGQQGGVWGLPTGGGGCSCELGAGAETHRGWGAWAALGLGLILARRRRPGRYPKRDAGVKEVL